MTTLKRAFVAAIATAWFTIMLGAILGTSDVGPVWTYGHPGITDNGGVEIQLQTTGCGLELWGHPGPFCDNGLDATGEVHGA